MPVTFDDIRQAQTLLKGNAVRTPFNGPNTTPTLRGSGG